jgi:queuine tRNA-ribosyltransferase subunit QTRTD1
MGNTDGSISIFTSVGFQSLSNNSYIDYVQKLNPDMVVALGDVPHGAIPGTKRMNKMGDRTSQWLDALVSTFAEAAPGDKPAIFAPILPIDFHCQSEYLHHLADDIADSISGLAFYSSSLLADIPATTALSRLPRLSLDEPSSPHHILRQISLGMDLFTIPFLNSATDAGLALTFQFPTPPSPTNTESTTPSPQPCFQSLSSPGPKPLAIDLSSPAHATALLPLLQSCTCYACIAHSRAYITHLLSAKEMLGWVLLQIHNHATISSFFAAVRESIAQGTFEEDRKKFEEWYESELPKGMGERPRARGYHFKSEGPLQGKGEGRRNKPAWGALGDGQGEGSGEGTPGLVPNGNARELEEKGFAEAVDRSKN